MQGSRPLKRGREDQYTVNWYRQTEKNGVPMVPGRELSALSFLFARIPRIIGRQLTWIFVIFIRLFIVPTSGLV